MILDNINNCELYYKINPHFEKAFNFLKYNLEKKLDSGRYEIDGDKVYALAMECDLLPEGRLESHTKYIDIQFICDGAEAMGYTKAEGLICTEDLSAEKDLVFYKNSDEAIKVRLHKNDFAVFFPQDAHAPCIEFEGNRDRKIVVKVLAE